MKKGYTINIQKYVENNQKVPDVCIIYDDCDMCKKKFQRGEIVTFLVSGRAVEDVSEDRDDEDSPFIIMMNDEDTSHLVTCSECFNRFRMSIMGKPS